MTTTVRLPGPLVRKIDALTEATWVSRNAMIAVLLNEAIEARAAQ